MGTPKTWHGVPDARLKSKLGDIGILPQRKNDNARLNDVNEIVVEAKRGHKEVKNSLSQLIAIAVVASITENKLHKGLGMNPMVPTVMIGPSSFFVCLYDCINDLSMISDEINWVIHGGMQSMLIDPAIWFLWMIINHRYYIIWRTYAAINMWFFC